MKGMKRLTACGLSFALIFSMTAYGIPAPAGNVDVVAITLDGQAGPLDRRICPEPRR